MEKFIIDHRVFDVKFKCNLEVCRGSCCTLKGAGGAPILDIEVMKIQSNVNIAKKYLSEKNKNVLDNEGFLEGEKGNYSINSVDDEDCVFSFYENGIAKCSFQKAFYNNETDFIKPISCHLFPLRISGNKRNIIRYEKISECEDALTYGNEQNITLFEFAKDPLIKEYGRDFYNDLQEKFLRRE